MTTAIAAEQIAASLGGLTLCLQGDPARCASSVAPVSAATKGCLTFIRGNGAELVRRLEGLEDAVVICRDDPALDGLAFPALTLIRTDNPDLGFIRAVDAHFGPGRPPAGIHALASVHASARIDASATIGPFCVIGAACEIGARTVLHANVTLYDRVRIGADVTVHAGTVIGADGFGYQRGPTGGRPNR